MKERHASNEDKPWENSFENNRDEQGNYSRTAARKKVQGRTVLTTSLIAIFVVIILGTIALYFITQSTSTKQVESSSKIEVISSSSASKSASHHASIKEHEASSSTKSVKVSSKAQALGSSQKAEIAKAQSEAVQAESSTKKLEHELEHQAKKERALKHEHPTASESRAATSSSMKAPGQYITIRNGQGIFGIARDNGLTVNKLLQLNPGLTVRSTILPGQKLRVS